MDFLSDDSQGQITAYFWDFGDGNNSTQANPTHAYQKAGNYTVTLRLDFANNNVLEETVEMEIFEE
ncbi:MAG: PKD domain-containing protein [Patescibacteria group bacterium]